MEVQKCGIIGAIAKFQLSGAYPVLFALICAISGLCDKRGYIPLLALLSALVLFSIIFVKDTRVLLVPVFMMYYALGTDNQNTYNETSGDVFASIDASAWNFIVVLAIILVTALIVRFSLDGTFKATLGSRGGAFAGILSIDVALIANGLFSPGWSLANTGIGLLLAACLTALYLIFCSIYKNSCEGIVTYVCKIMTLTSSVVVVQMLAKAMRACADGSFIYYHESTARWVVDRTLLCASWGITTIAGGVLILGIPAALCLARNEKHPLVYSVSAILFAAMPIIMNTRASILVGALLLLAGAIIICISGKNKRVNRIFFLSVFAAAAMCFFGVVIHLESTGELSHYAEKLLLLSRFDIFEDRIALLHIGEQHFLQSPLFGVGILEGAAPEGIVYNNVFANMYHNIPMQFAASMGILGTVAFIFHIKDFVMIGLRGRSAERILIMLLPLAILLLSLADNFFFYPNFMIFYTAFLALADNNTNKKNGLG